MFDCFRPLQACKPSYHVWSNAISSALPHFPNQEPPRPQQLIWADFLAMPHFGHTKLVAVVTAATCEDWSITRTDIELSSNKMHVQMKIHVHASSLGLTFTSAHALKPRVIKVSITSASTVLEPSTGRGATTAFARFWENAAFWAYPHTSNR